MTSSVIRPNIEPSIINKQLLVKCVLKECADEEVKKLLTEEGVQLDIVTVLRLDFLKLVKIERLWMLKSLTKLTIAHNKIEAIENLEELTNLKELDLSFNAIRKIENLDKLKNIEVLMLNNNRIEELKNLEELINMIVFSISGNLIADYKQAVYLRRFKCLKSLSFKDNPCCEDPLCDSFIKAVLQQLTYVNYLMVSNDERKRCVKMFGNLVKQLDEADELSEIARKNKIQLDEITELHLKSFVEYLNGCELLEIMFEADRDGYVLLNGCKELSEEYEEYKSHYVEMMQEFIEYGQNQYYIREQELEDFQQIVDAAKERCAERCREIVETYLSEKENILDKITSINKDDSVDIENKNTIREDCVNKLQILIEALWKNLMSEEITLYEKCEETRDEFGKNMKELVDKFIDVGKDIFIKWREREYNWAIYEQDIFNKIISGEIIADAPEITFLVSDKDVLMDIIKLSYGNHIQFINDREELLIARINKWLSDLIHELKWNHIHQNRSKISEISDFIKLQNSDANNLNVNE